MSFLDSDWINALKLPTRVMSGLFIACTIVLALNSWGVLAVDELGVAAKPIVMLLAIFSGSLAATGIVGLFWDQWESRRKHSLLTARRKEKLAREAEARTAAEQAALERIDHLSSKELRHLAACLRSGSQSFTAWAHDPAVATLMGKHLVYTPGGTHHQDHYPFTIHDFVWKALLARKEELLERDVQNAQREENGRRARPRR